jgi:hypothetical protein
MVDSSKISNLPVAPTQTQRSSFAKAKDVQSRAAITDHKQSAQERRALKRLDDLLASSEVPRTDVPRGYYLDLLV